MHTIYEFFICMFKIQFLFRIEVMFTTWRNNLYNQMYVINILKSNKEFI